MNKTRSLVGGMAVSAVLLAWLFLTIRPEISPMQEPESLIVFAASSMAYVLEETRKDIEVATGMPVIIVEAASSALARQIENGAPADVFITADQVWLDYLKEAGHFEGVPVEVAQNRLILALNPISHFSRCSVQFVAQPDAPTILTACPYKGLVATGDPEFVPLGKYANEAIQYYNWNLKFAPAQNARAALALVQGGAVEAGILYKSDLTNTTLSWAEFSIPPESHTPIIYWAAPVKQSNTVATESFLNFLQSDAFKTILKAKGFEVD